MLTVSQMRHAIRILRDGDWPAAILGKPPQGWRLGGNNHPLCEHFARELERSLEGEEPDAEPMERIET